jgi:4-amino-4-deoxy-L-arabinose transferase-like glycosyltransferase
MPAPQTASIRRRASSLWFVFGVALLVRLVVSALLYSVQLDPQRDHWEFGWETGRIAHSIATGQGFASPLYGSKEGSEGLTAWMAPLYPYLLAGVFRAFGSFSAVSAFVILALNSLFSAATCWPVFHIARRVFGGPTAKWAAWAWAFYPFAIYFAADRVWETCLTTLLFSLVMWLTLVLADGPRLQLWLLYGGVWALAALTSPVTLSALPPLLGWIVCRTAKGSSRTALLGRVCAASLVFLVLVSPWFVRNYRTFHQFIPFRDNLGLEMWVGNNGDTSDVYIDSAHPAHNPAELQRFVTAGEIIYFKEKKAQALGFIEHHPGWFLWVTVRRFAFTWTGFWSLSHDYLANEPFEIPNVFFSSGLSALMLLGIRSAVRHSWAGSFPLIAGIVMVPMVYYFTHVDPNYRHPVDPEVLIFITVGIRTSWSAWRNKPVEVGIAATRI